MTSPEKLNLQSLNKRELILTAWEELDCESVGRKELEQLQQRITEVLGEAAVDSPAAIARIVADEGAHLRHPEVLEYDSAWRQQQLAQFENWNLSFASLSDAAAAMIQLQALRLELLEEDRVTHFNKLIETIVASRDECRVRAVSLLISARERAEAREVASWLSIWVQTPDVFADWLDLRRSAPEFLKEFGG
jgi:hypothetical protein